MTTNIGRALLSISTVILASSIASAASAETRGRHPLKAEPKRTSSLWIDRYDRPAIIERERTETKKEAVFHADPQEIEANAVLLFEIRSVSTARSVSRWRCIATTDVAECLGAPVAVRYLPGDEKMVLTITAKPKSAPETMALIDQVRDTKLVIADKK